MTNSKHFSSLLCAPSCPCSLLCHWLWFPHSSNNTLGIAWMSCSFFTSVPFPLSKVHHSQEPSLMSPTHHCLFPQNSEREKVHLYLVPIFMYFFLNSDFLDSLSTLYPTLQCSLNLTTLVFHSIFVVFLLPGCSIPQLSTPLCMQWLATKWLTDCKQRFYWISS